MVGVFTRIRVRILSIVLLAIIPAIGLIWYSAEARKRQISEEIESNVLRLSRILAGNLERDLLQGEGYLRALARSEDLLGSRPDSCRAALSGILGDTSVYANLGLAASDGTILCSAAPLPKAHELGRLEWFQKAGVPGSLAVGFDYKGILSHQASLNLGMALPEARGRKRGEILFAVMDLDWLNRLAEKSQLPPGSALSLTNQKGDAVVRYPDPDKWVGKPYPQALLQEARIAEREGVRNAKGIDGIERLYAFAAVKGKGSFVVQIGIRREAVYAPANRILYQQLAALGLVSLMAILAAWFGADVFLLKQVNALIGATRRLAGGDLTSRSSLSYEKGELGDLARAFDEMAEKLEWREAQLRESETERANPVNQIAELLDLAPEPALLLGEDLQVEACNRAARLLFGYREEDDLTGNSFTAFCPESAVWPRLQPGAGAAHGLEAIGLRPDGSVVPLEVSVSKSVIGRKPFLVAIARPRQERSAGRPS